MKTVHRNDGFICSVCKENVLPASGTCRNHCTMCLSSMHVDILPGDRKSTCHGILKPLSATYHAKKGYMIAFRCQKCGFTGRNKASDEDNIDRLSELIMEANRQAAGLK